MFWVKRLLAEQMQLVSQGITRIINNESSGNLSQLILEPLNSPPSSIATLQAKDKTPRGKGATFTLTKWLT